MLRRLGERPVRPGKPICERLPLAGRLATLAEGHEGDLIAFVGERGAVEAAVERDERTMAIARGKLIPLVEVHAVRSPVGAESHQRLIVARAVDALRPSHE